MFTDLPENRLNSAAHLLIMRPADCRKKLAAVFRKTPKCHRERLMSYVCFIGYPWKD